MPVTVVLSVFKPARNEKPVFVCFCLKLNDSLLAVNTPELSL